MVLDYPDSEVGAHVTTHDGGGVYRPTLSVAPIIDVSTPPAAALPAQLGAALGDAPDVSAAADLTAFLAGDIDVDDYVARAWGRTSSPAAATPLLEPTAPTSTTEV